MDEMDRAHSLDVEKEHRLRAARLALKALQNGDLPTAHLLLVAQLAGCIKHEMDHIVARWN